MNFVFTYAPGTTLEQMVAFETAGRLWSSNLTDNVTVNIYVEPTNTLPVGVAGGALMGVQADQAYSTWRTRLAADSQTSTDRSIQQNLPSNTTSFTAWVNEVGPEGLTSNKLEQTGSTINLSRANAKALGLTNTQAASLDGYILMNNQLPSLGLTWNYNLDGALPANSVDFFSVAVHEIGHILGFYSGVDASGWQITPIDGFFNDDDDDDDDSSGSGRGTDGDRSILQNATGLDMLRFSNEDSIDLVIGGSPFYSIDGGTTKTADYATGVDRNLGGDGFQASHWRASSGALGIMEPSIAPGQRKGLRPLDRQALDAIGWDAGTGQANLTTLQNQAKAALAVRLGVSVAQLEANPGLAQQLTQDRGQDAIAMIDQSQIYERRFSSRGRRTGYWDSIDLPPSAASARLASTTTTSGNNPANNSLATGWGLGTETIDQLMTGGQNQSVSPLAQQNAGIQSTGFEMAPSFLPPSPMLSASTAVAPIDPLTTTYFGAEVVQSPI